ncbi:MAG: tetratricopeptide repeat protein, partial [Cyanobacteria bacterium]|nr:tetratricopeptide repeat protein [Cyanobacteriota bacterium]MDW8202971.1 tetratricopeptide repeat protein [Cyanobacteriota bacterium SKYGB_h_bin112]
YRDPVENLQQAVLAYQEALRYRTEDADAKKRAATQNNLGTAYWHLAQHQQPVIYLRQAIAAYSEALQFYSPDEDSLTYAMVQNNLGTAYWNLSQHEQPVELLQQAIAAYDIALRYRTADATPVAHAATQNNLGTAYWHLANHQKHQPAIYHQLLQQAIAAYLITLNTANKVPPEQLSFDLFATHNNLGLAYYQLAIDKQSPLTAETRLNHLDFSLHHHLQAYNGWQSHPDYAQAALAYVIQTLRAFHSEFGLQGQSRGLSKLPAHLLPQVLPRL